MKGLAVLVVFSIVVFTLINAHQENEEEFEAEINPRFVRAAEKQTQTGETSKAKKAKKKAAAKKAKHGKKAKKSEKAQKSLAGKSAVETRQASNTGAECNYVDLGTLSSKGSGCSADGSKFVLKGATGVRKQFLVLNGKTIIGFVKTKFSDCAASGFTDITSKVVCKVVAGLPGVILSAGTGATSGTTTAKSTASGATAATTNSSITTFRLPTQPPQCAGLTPAINGTNCTGQELVNCLLNPVCVPGKYGRICSFNFSACVPGVFFGTTYPQWYAFGLTCQATSSDPSSCLCLPSDASGLISLSTTSPVSDPVCGLDNVSYSSACLAITVGLVFPCATGSCPCPATRLTSSSSNSWVNRLLEDLSLIPQHHHLSSNSYVDTEY